MILMCKDHRVGRVLSVSPVIGIGTPPPLLPQASVPPHPLVWGGGHTRLRLKRWGSPNSNEGTYTVVLYIYKYFVARTINHNNREHRDLPLENRDPNPKVLI
jgi:hypothetical protein